MGETSKTLYIARHKMQSPHGTWGMGKLLERNIRQETLSGYMKVCETRGGVMGLCRTHYSQAGDPEYIVRDTMH